MSDDTAARPMSIRQDIWATRLSSVWDVGVIVAGAERQIDFANQRARAMLGVSSDAELEIRWQRLADRLGGAFDAAPTGDGVPVTDVAVTIDPRNPDTAYRVQIYGLTDEECAGHLLLIQPAERAAAIEAALRHATHDRSLASLVRDTAHDLKGLLNVVTMNVEILARAAERGAESQGALAERSANVVRRELTRINRTIEVILDPGGASPQPAPFDVRRTCEALAELVAARARRQRVQITLRLPPVPADVVGYQDRVHGALLNLVVNALDAMPDGGTLVLEVEKERAVRVAVSDTGPGVDSSSARSIWRLHYTSKPGGTGIGLHVTRTVAEAHGGRVWLDSNPDGGARFIVELPAASASTTSKD